MVAWMVVYSVNEMLHLLYSPNPTLQHEEGGPGQRGPDVGGARHLQRPRDDAQTDGVDEVRVRHGVDRRVTVLGDNSTNQSMNILMMLLKLFQLVAY